jgi:hypothetical protein
VRGIVVFGVMIAMVGAVLVRARLRMRRSTDPEGPAAVMARATFWSMAVLGPIVIVGLIIGYLFGV